MIKQGAKIETSVGNGVLIFKLIGEIDHHNAKILRMQMDEKIILHRPQKTVLDLSHIDFMDSSGLGLIMGRYNTAKELGGVLVLRDPCKKVEKVLLLAGIERFISVERSTKGVM